MDGGLPGHEALGICPGLFLWPQIR
jgi:hypothetical protein